MGGGYLGDGYKKRGETLGELAPTGLGAQGGRREEGEVREVMNEPGEAETGPV